MHKAKIIVTFVLSLFSCSVAAWETPLQAISEYLKFELSGGRLASEKWKIYISKYIDAPEGYAEPGWDMITVVNNYKIGEINCTSSTTCAANVSFSLYPTEKLNNPSVLEHKQGGNLAAKYYLVKKGKEWLVQPGAPGALGEGAPVASIETYHRHMKRITGK